MWSVGRKSVDIYLGHDSVAWRVVGRDAVRAAVATPHEGLQAAQKAIEGLGRIKIRLWLSGRLAPPFLVEPVPGVKGHRELRQIAEAVAQQATGLAEPCEVWIEPRAGRDEVVVGVAVARTLVASVQEMLGAGSSAHLQSIRPWWALVQNRALARNKGKLQILRVEEPDGLVLLAAKDRTFACAAAYWPASAVENRHAMVARALLNADVPSAKGWRVVWGGDASKSSDVAGFAATWEAIE